LPIVRALGCGQIAGCFSAVLVEQVEGGVGKFKPIVMTLLIWAFNVGFRWQVVLGTESTCEVGNERLMYAVLTLVPSVLLGGVAAVCTFFTENMKGTQLADCRHPNWCLKEVADRYQVEFWWKGIVERQDRDPSLTAAEMLAILVVEGRPFEARKAGSSGKNGLECIDHEFAEGFR